MLDKTLGYILCCQSPALFLAALALLVAYLAGRKHRVKAFFRLLLCILCAAGAVALAVAYILLTILPPGGGIFLARDDVAALAAIPF